MRLHVPGSCGQKSLFTTLPLPPTTRYVFLKSLVRLNATQFLWPVKITLLAVLPLANEIWHLTGRPGCARCFFTPLSNGVIPRRSTVRFCGAYDVHRVANHRILFLVTIENYVPRIFPLAIPTFPSLANGKRHVQQPTLLSFPNTIIYQRVTSLSNSEASSLTIRSKIRLLKVEIQLF